MQIRTFFVSITGWIACFAGCAGGIRAAEGEIYPPQAVSILEDPHHARSSVTSIPYTSQRQSASSAPLTINGKPVSPQNHFLQIPDPGNVPPAVSPLPQTPRQNVGSERSILVPRTAEDRNTAESLNATAHSVIPTPPKEKIQAKEEEENVWRILPDGGSEASENSIQASAVPKYADGRPAADRQLTNGVPAEMIPEMRSGDSVSSEHGTHSILGGAPHVPSLHPGAQWTVQPENAVGNSAAQLSGNTRSLPRYIVAKAEPASELEKTLNPHTDLERERTELVQELKKHNKILKAQANVLKLAAKIIRPSVVHIQSDAFQSGQYGERLKIHDEGSGIIIRRQEKFFVLTNQHVIKNALPQDIEIRLHDNRLTHPTRILYDKETDIAVLELTETDLIPARLGDSNRVDIGDFVLAVGSPFGLDNSVTFGIVSAIGRRTIELASNAQIQDFIQTDAAINPGNSGGPLLDMNAEVIGMNTAIASNSGNNAGIAFSIPIRMVILVADQLIVYGKTRRAYLGVNLEKDFTMQQAREIGLEHPRGALVTTVLNPSPAFQAKFRKGDLILEFNGIPIEDDMHLYNLVNLAEIDEKVTLKVYREGEIYEVEVQLWER